MHKNYFALLCLLWLKRELRQRSHQRYAESAEKNQLGPFFASFGEFGAPLNCPTRKLHNVEHRKAGRLPQPRQGLPEGCVGLPFFTYWTLSRV